MKVLHVIESIDKSQGGLPFALFNLLGMEQLIGIKPSVLTVSGQKPEGFEEVDFYIFQASFPKRLKRSRQASHWMKSNVRMFDLLVFHSTWNILCLECAKISHGRNVPYMIWPHGSLDPFDLRKKRLLKKLLGPLFIRSYIKYSVKLCVTASEEAKRLETYGAHPKVEILPLPVNVDRDLGSREKFRAKYNFKDDDFVFLFLSRINYKKGLDTLIYACHNIMGNHKDIFLVLAGPDSNGYLERVESMISKLNLRDRVNYIGPLDLSEKADAFKGSDCFILPSKNENFGIAIVESLQYGLPVIISNNVYISQEIADGQSGWVCDASVEAVQNVVINLINNKSDYRKRKANTTKVGSKFTSSNLKTFYKAIYFDK